MKFNFVFIAFVFLFVSCTTETNVDTSIVQTDNKTTPVTNPIPLQFKQIAEIDKPFNSIDIPFKEFNYKNGRENVIELETGTVIKIPKNGFKDKGGNSIKNNIKIKYREFHTVSDIMLSGINMTYQEDDFESAGMFEIRAFLDDKELELRQNKEIIVDMASYKKGNFNSYYMADGSWEDLGKSMAKPNTNKQKKLDEIDEIEASVTEVCQTAPRKYNPGEELFDLDFNSGEYQELELFEGAMWTLMGGEKEKTTFKRDRNIYTFMEIEPKDSCGLFTLSLWDSPKIGETKKISNYEVSPVWKGTEYKRIKNKYKQRMAEYKATMKEIKRNRMLYRKEADILRSFSLKGMGIYNCDRPLRYLKLLTVGIVISCKEKIKSWWYLTQDKRIAIKYYQANDPNFKYNPNSSNAILALLENGEVVTLNESDFLKAYQQYTLNDDPEKQIEINLLLEDKKEINTQNDFASCVIDL